jgi:hypothetical protein
MTVVRITTVIVNHTLLLITSKSTGLNAMSVPIMLLANAFPPMLQCKRNGNFNIRFNNYTQ